MDAIATAKKFQELVQRYCRAAGYTQEQLAQDLGMHPTGLSRKLHQAKGAFFSRPEIKSIVKLLAQEQAITTQAEALELLELVGLSAGSFSLEEWKASPLKSLDPLSAQPSLVGPKTVSSLSAIEIKAQPKASSTTEITPEKVESVTRHNLPLQLTSFIGREQQIAELEQRLAPNVLTSSRLLTLAGTGGAGKTRLALQVASRLLGSFPDGVWFIELAPLSDPTLLPHTIAEALGLREDPNQPLLNVLTDYLSKKKLLLILDNCEHLVDAASHLADTLLRVCPRLRLLATSREVLGVAGEIIWQVPSLSLPATQVAPALDGLLNYEAVQLFVERASAVQPGFKLLEHNALAVTEICRRLDGIPLALELAAAHIRVLSLEQIASRLTSCFRLLTEGGRLTLPRHRTLRGAIDWSYNLLSPSEQHLLQRISVFVGGANIEAVEAVCAGEGLEEYEVLDLLLHLINKSLVVVSDEQGQEVRYRLLETIRQYAHEKLVQAGGEEWARNQHLAYFLCLAEDAERKLASEEQVFWLNRLENEHDNFRAALSWSMKEGKTEQALRLSGALVTFWGWRGYFNEGRRWLETTLALPQAVEPVLRMKLLIRAGWFARGQSDLAKAQTFLNEATTIGRILGDKEHLAQTIHDMGVLARTQGNYSAAQAFYQEALAIWREIQNQRLVAMGLFNLALVGTDIGDYDLAQSCFEEALAINRMLKDKLAQVGNLDGLGFILILQHKPALAVPLFEEALAIYGQLGNKNDNTGLLGNRGLAARLLKDYNLARSLYRRALSAQYELQDKFQMAYSLEYLAGLAAVEGEAVRAARLFGAAEKLREIIGSPLAPSDRELYTQDVAEARAQLSQEAFAEEWAVGRAMAMEQLIEYALSVPVTS